MTGNRSYPYHTRRRSRSVRFPFVGFQMRTLGGGLVALVLLGYVGFQLYGLFAPPRLTLITPLDGTKWSRRSIEVRGSTVPGTHISVNGGTISTDDQGHFSTVLVLGEGLNTIAVRAEKRYGRARTMTRTVLVEDAVSVAPARESHL